MSELITGKPKWTVLMHRLFNSQKGGNLSEMKWILIGSFVISKIYHGFLDYLNASYMEKEPENLLQAPNHLKGYHIFCIRG
jgi:hypothetical protein